MRRLLSFVRLENWQKMVSSPISAQDLRSAMLWIAAMFFVSRAALLLIAHIALLQFGPVPGLSDTGVASSLCRWDCDWYLNIAANGYSPVEVGGKPGATTFSFYPLFPLLVRLIAPAFGGNHLFAALALTNTCFVAGLVYVYRYARLLDAGHAAALLAVGLLCVMPQSLSFSAVYSESPFLLLLVVAMYYLRTRRYLVAGIAAALLSATRPNGIFFALFALAWIIRNAGLQEFFAPWRVPERYLPILMAPLGAFAFMAFCYMTTGDAFAHLSTEFYGWGWSFGSPWESLRTLLNHDAAQRLAAAEAIGVMLCSLLLIRQRCYEEFVMCAALILLILCGQAAAAQFRYWLVLFPVWIAVARVLASRPSVSATTFASLASINGLMTCAWALQRPISF